MATAKISGYLEKKGRKKMMSCYKKYWFVLEGRLLLYYRSKDEYEAISPCKGSVNLGPTCHVKPCMRVGVFQIISRTTTITLRAETREEQHKWMQAIMTALNHSTNPARLSHFRYSLGELTPEPKKPLERQNTMPERLNAPKHCNPGIIEKLQKMGAQSYLDFSKTQCQKKTQSLELPRSTLIIKNVDHETNPDDDDDFEKLYERIPSTESIVMGRTSLLIENADYIGDDKTYAEPKYEVIDYNENSVQYSTPDKENPYSVPVLTSEDEQQEESGYARVSPKNSSASSGSLEEERRTKIFKGFGKRNKSNKCTNESKTAGLKKSESFLQRVWRKKNKKSKNADSLSVNDTSVNEMELSDAGTIKMLSALQNVLESKKPIIEQTLITETRKNETTQEDKEGTNDTTKNLGDLDAVCPELPPRNQRPTDISPYHDVPKSNQAISVPPEIPKISEESGPEKLDDEEQVPREGKVKDLIKRFSEDFEGVEIRQKPIRKNSRHSEELNRLLDELSKITSAPIMTPGVTSSMVNPEIPDSELLKLIPIRRRRLSDPDYDVPRSHKVENLPKKLDKEITGTRFFGPALVIGDLTDTKQNFSSITPDSLEIDSLAKRTNLQEDTSYQSHDYLNIRKNSHHRVEYLVENCLYAEPMLSIHQKSDSVARIVYDTPKTIDDDNVFVDSLETPPRPNI